MNAKDLADAREDHNKETSAIYASELSLAQQTIKQELAEAQNSKKKSRKTLPRFWRS